MLAGAEDHSWTEWALDFVYTRSPAVVTLHRVCPSDGYASKCEQGSLFICLLFYFFFSQEALTPIYELSGMTETGEQH